MLILLLQIIIYTVGLTAILLTILPFLKFGFWLVRIGEFPRLQIAFVCLLTAILTVLLLRPPGIIEIVFLLSLIACTIYQIFCVLPYLPFYPKQVEKAVAPIDENTIRLLIFNVFIENRKSQNLLDLVERVNPDLILLAEPDARWLDEIAALEKDYPHTVLCPLDNAYGLALYSRLELVGEQLNFLVEDDIPSIAAQVRLASGKLIDLYCLHPRPPVPTESDRSDERDAELLLVGRIIKESDAPTIICGDLNDVACRGRRNFFKKSAVCSTRASAEVYTVRFTPIIR
ncbi:MAG: endonuclease/exonuclease/phosphatase family protein [Pyrinomonadaceae bacterium]|nr:endonuclease/exonuclease/phosphatase family protein [Pyrinomonadaceae bacterium]